MKFSGAGLGKKLEVATNIAIIFAVALIAIKILKPEWLSRERPAAPPPASISVGNKVALPAADWSGHEKNVVMVLREGCHYCSASAPFYQKLVHAAEKAPGVHLMAVLPQEPPQAKKYLEKLGVTVGDVQQAPLGSLKIAGTPTLLLVDRAGVVKNVWVGQLDGQGQADVLSKTGLVQAN